MTPPRFVHGSDVRTDYLLLSGPTPQGHGPGERTDAAAAWERHCPVQIPGFAAVSTGTRRSMAHPDVSTPAAFDPARTDRVAVPDALGVRQNARLTAVTGFLLLLLLGAELVTALGIDGMIGPHLVIGAAVLAPLVLKLGTTGWKIVHYYVHAPAYVRAGPPSLLRRFLAPFVIVTTVGLLGTGTALMVLGPANAGRLATFHRAFFAAWCAALALHVLLHVLRSARAVRAEVTATSTEALPGRWQRALVLAGTLAVGLGLAAWAAQHVAPWSIALHR